MSRLYERVRLINSIYLDFTGDVMKAGSEATVVDLLDDDVVLIEFDFEEPGLVGGKRFETATAMVYDLVAVS